MKKFLKIAGYSLLGIIGLTLILVLYLYFHYNTLEKEVILADRSLKPPTGTILLSSIRNSKESLLNLIPVPHKVLSRPGTFSLHGSLTFSSPDSLKNLTASWLSEIESLKPLYSPSGGIISFRYRAGIPAQGYNLDIAPGRVIVEFSTRQGLWYGIVSLKVLGKNYNGRIPCAHIEDYPDLQVRGMMLDISRNKVPSRETLIRIAGLLSDLKFNHFELYVEGFSFAYPSFNDLWEKTETPLTGEDIKALDAFCKDHFIDLVPNQNMFGHMMAWLSTDRFSDLAECPKGYKLMGLLNMKGTLDPSDPRSIALVTKMADDLLPNFSSVNFNVNMDETFDLGKGKSKKLCEEKGEGNVYFDYALKVHDLVNARHKKMMMWGDIILKHPEVISRIPKDVTLLDWGYEADYPFDKNSKMLHEAGVNFIVCPGTSSWSSIVGRSSNMMVNITNAVKSGVRYGARGMLLTDWGDMGHWQYLPVSYPGYAFGGSLSWNSEDPDSLPLTEFLDSYIFMDRAGIMGNLALNLGKYTAFEERPAVSMTETMMGFQLGLSDEVLVASFFDKMVRGITDIMDASAPELVAAFKEHEANRKAYNFKGMYELIDSAGILLSSARLAGKDSSQVKDEYKNALRLLHLGADLQYYIRFRRDMLPDKQKELLEGMKTTGVKYLEENKKLWMARNKPGNYDTSIAMLEKLMKEIDKRIAVLNSSKFARSFNRFIEKVTTSAAAIYIKNS